MLARVAHRVATAQTTQALIAVQRLTFRPSTVTRGIVNSRQSVPCDLMGYSLVFLPREPGQSWDDAREAADERGVASLPDPAAWNRIVTEAGRILGDVSVFVTDRYYELDHDETGIQLLCNTSDGIGITAPYGQSDEDAVTVLMYRLGRVVEEATGLQGYDPQLDLPLSDAVAHADQSAGLFGAVAAIVLRAQRTAQRAPKRQRDKQRPPQQEK